MRGFTLLPVVLAMSVIAAIAFLLNRDNGLNARMITQQSDVERARYAAEAGLQAANFVVQAAGCWGIHPTFSAPVRNSNFGGASYSAHSTTLIGSPATLVSTGTYKDTSVTLTRANVHVYEPRKTVVVQLGASPGQDTHVHTEFPDRNYGAEQSLRLLTGKYQPLLRFDVSGLPAGSRVVTWYDPTSGALTPGATLSLYQTQGGSSSPAAVNVHLVTRSWVQGTQFGDSPASGATWNTYDGVNAWPSPGVGYASVPVASNAHTTTQGWKDWDVTDAVAGWLSGVYPNHGLWLVDAGGSIGDTYYESSEGGSATRRPKLTLNYLQPCGSAKTAYIDLAADAYLKSDDYKRNYGGALDIEVSSGSGTPRALVRFDVSSIPPGSVVQSAVLRLYCNDVDSATNNAKTIRAYYVRESWVEGTMDGEPSHANGATWNTRDGARSWTGGSGGYADFDNILATGRDEASGVAPLPAAFQEGWVTFDLTAMVQSWVDRTSANYGILLLSTTSDKIEFDSRQSTGGRTPQLVVEYR